MNKKSITLFAVFFLAISAVQAEFSAWQDEKYNFVDTDHNIYADIGVALADEPVVFEVSGLNSASATVLTDVNGQATYTYSSLNPGFDTITVCSDLDHDNDCDAEEPTVELSKYWLDEIMHGGGHLLDDTADKRKDWLDVSFGGTVGRISPTEFVGDWLVRLHNVNADLDKTNFKTTNIVFWSAFPGNGELCQNSANIIAEGKFGGNEGYWLFFQGGDSGQPASLSTDTARVIIAESFADLLANNFVYDSFWPTEFGGISNCWGTQQTTHDKGNLVVLR